MTTATLLGLMLLGILAGGSSGILGIGGGIIVVPALIYFFDFNYKQAVGTSLGMMLPPVGIFAFLTYYHAGLVDLRAAGSLALTFAIGALVTAVLINKFQVPDQILKRVFGFVLLYVAGNMLFKSDHTAGAAAKTFLVLGAGAVIYVVSRLAGQKWHRELTSTELYAKYRYPGSKSDYTI